MRSENLHFKTEIYRNIKLQNIRKFFLERLMKRLSYKDINEKENKNNQSKKTLYAVNEENFKIFEEIIQKTKYIAEENNINLNFVYMPSWNRYINTDYNQLIKKILKLTNELEVNFINLDKELFKTYKDPLNHFPFRINSHYNEETYEDISKILIKYIN